MTDRAVCYVGDMNFMLPTLIAAIQIRRFVPAHKTTSIKYTRLAMLHTSGQGRMAYPSRIRIPSSNSAETDHLRNTILPDTVLEGL